VRKVVSGQQYGVDHQVVKTRLDGNVDETDIALASFHASNVGAVKVGQFG
jgi:hypothetical protein